jgi:two-component system, sporulation sensor kinase E
MVSETEMGNSSFISKVLGNLDRLDRVGIESVVKRLAKERNLLDTLFHVIEDGLLVLDSDGVATYLNQAAARILGVPKDRLEGQHVDRFLPEVGWDRLSKLDLRGESPIVRHEFEISFPRPRFLRMYAAPLDGDSQGASGLALVLQDSTEDRQKTFETIESERIQALTLLAGSVAHELGNPLNALFLHLQLMEREFKKLRSIKWTDAGNPVNDRGRDPKKNPALILQKLENYLSVASGEVSRLDYIVTQFLQTIRSGAPKIQSASLNDIVNSTVELLEPEIDNRGQVIRTFLDASLPDSDFDPAQIRQILINLIKNAMHAMTRGGILTIETGVRDAGVWVSVSDTGHGIPQDQINRIFEPYFSTKEKGTGLGLMLVQRIIQDHRGRIELESPPGKGTTFRIWLPVSNPLPRLLERGETDSPATPTTDKAHSPFQPSPPQS